MYFNKAACRIVRINERSSRTYAFHIHFDFPLLCTCDIIYKYKCGRFPYFPITHSFRLSSKHVTCGCAFCLKNKKTMYDNGLTRSKPESQMTLRVLIYPSPPFPLSNDLPTANSLPSTYIYVLYSPRGNVCKLLCLLCRFHSSTVTALRCTASDFAPNTTHQPCRWRPSKLESFLNCLKMSFIMQIIGPRVIEQFYLCCVHSWCRAGFMWCAAPGLFYLRADEKCPLLHLNTYHSKDRPGAPIY